jgi:hypothetical protein
MSAMLLMLAGAGVASASPCTDNGGTKVGGTCVYTTSVKPPGHGTQTTEVTGLGGGGGEPTDTGPTLNKAGNAPGGLNK